MRVFRYAGTVTAAQVVASFVSAGSALAEARDTAQYQLEQEERKSKKRDAVRRPHRTGGAAWAHLARGLGAKPTTAMRQAATFQSI